MLWQPAIISHNSWFWGDYCSHKPFYKNWQLGKQCKKIRWYLEVLSLIFYQSVMEFLASKKCWRGNLRLKLQIVSQESEAWTSWQSERFDYFQVTDAFCLSFFILCQIYSVFLFYFFTSSLYQDSPLFNLKYFSTFGTPVLDPQLCPQMKRDFTAIQTNHWGYKGPMRQDKGELHSVYGTRNQLTETVGKLGKLSSWGSSLN